ncbi:MAG: RDD family protein [Clostridiales bacterium]|jgi:uncharacterized RDD family membrane protein YckC|nr:RDD family protein [Clostridiales bacterium]
MTQPSITSDALPRVKHPWRRFLARQLDNEIYFIIWFAVSMLALRWNTGRGLFVILLEAYITFFLMLLFEPLLLCTLGTTPGKWIFGLRVRDDRGGKLTYSSALLRTWRVFHYGYGFGIPFYNLYRNYKCYKICRISTSSKQTAKSRKSILRSHQAKGSSWIT